MAVFALIHGAWHTAKAFEGFIPELESRGHEVVAVDLPAEDPEAGSAEYAAVVHDALGDAEDVVAVGHSLGALPAAHLATLRPLRHLVYLTPGYPRPGYSLAEAQAEEPYSMDPVLEVAENVPGDLLRFPQTHGDLFYNACTFSRSKEAASWLRLQATKPITEKCTIDAQPDVPTTIVLGTLDRVLDPDMMTTIARKRLGLEPIYIRSDHSPFISVPSELADLLVSLV